MPKCGHQQEMNCGKNAKDFICKIICNKDWIEIWLKNIKILIMWSIVISITAAKMMSKIVQLISTFYDFQVKFDLDFDNFGIKMFRNLGFGTWRTYWAHKISYPITSLLKCLTEFIINRGLNSFIHSPRICLK